MREKLIGLLLSIPQMRIGIRARTQGKGAMVAAHIADHLIANGVTIPVRCKDCKHYIKNIAINRMCCYVHLLSPHAMREDDFCSYGERKMVNLEDIVDLDAQTKANNEAIRSVIDFMAGERSANETNSV